MRKVTAPVLAAVIGAALLFFSGAPVQASAACPAGEPPGRPPGQNGSRPGNTGRSTQYPPGGCQLLLSLNAASSTTAVHVSGSGFSPHSGVQVAMAGQNRIGATTDADGTFVTDFVVPSVDPGDYTVTASGTDGSGPRVLA